MKQDRNRLKDTQNKLVVSSREGSGGMSGIDEEDKRYKFPVTK